jgi:hypothetical protein
VAHIFIVIMLLAEISFVTISSANPFYSEEMRVLDFIKQPGVVLLQTLLLRFRPLNIDVLPLYVVLMFFLPVVLVLMKWRADITLALSVALYALTWKFDWYLSAYPDGYWAFNPFAWQLLFVFGAWCALGGARRMSRILASRITLWICLGYLLASFLVTMTWYFPQLGFLMPHWLEQWIYPIDKTDLDVLRFAHFLALAVIAVRFVPGGWPGLNSRWLWPMILCGQRSLEIFCLGVVLGFTGYFVLTELSAGLGRHVVVGICGMLLMSAAAWLLSWYKHYVDESGPRIKSAGGNAGIAGGGP